MPGAWPSTTAYLIVEMEALKICSPPLPRLDHMPSEILHQICGYVYQDVVVRPSRKTGFPRTMTWAKRVAGERVPEISCQRRQNDECRTTFLPIQLTCKQLTAVAEHHFDKITLELDSPEDLELLHSTRERKGLSQIRWANLITKYLPGKRNVFAEKPKTKWLDIGVASSLETMMLSLESITITSSVTISKPTRPSSDIRYPPLHQRFYAAKEAHEIIDGVFNPPYICRTGPVQVFSEMTMSWLFADACIDIAVSTKSQKLYITKSPYCEDIECEDCQGKSKDSRFGLVTIVKWDGEDVFQYWAEWCKRYRRWLGSHGSKNPKEFYAP